MPSIEIDELYDTTVAELPANLQLLARDLPHRLKFGATGSRFSEVFNHEITLGAPALFAEAIGDVDPALVRDATLAHLLGVIEAFGADRIHDKQIDVTQELVDLMTELRARRDRAAARISPDVPQEFSDSDVATQSAMADETKLFETLGSCSFGEYTSISLAKQSPGFPATLGLARASGWPLCKIRSLRAALEDVWLGIQFGDDANDWREDWEHMGGAWAVCLARGLRAERGSDEHPTRPDAVGRFVYESGVLPRLLDLARRHFSGARRRARALGAERVAVWALGQEQLFAKDSRGESAEAGFLERKRILEPLRYLVMR